MQDRIEKLASICREHGVRELYSFGSRGGEIFRYVRGEIDAIGKSSSDIDIGARFHRESSPSPKQKVALAFALEEFFGYGTVDLVLLEEASPFLALDIIRGELLHATDLDDQARYELFVLARAGDLIYYEMERRKNSLSAREP